MPKKWLEMIRSLSDECKFSDPAAEKQIVAVEKALQLKLPMDLRSFLRESDGLTTGQFGCCLVWPATRIVKDNLDFRRRRAFRNLYMPFDHLLFFGDPGDGGQFAYAILNGKVRTQNVFEWDHETDSRQKVAMDFRQFLERWFRETLY